MAPPPMVEFPPPGVDILTTAAFPIGRSLSIGEQVLQAQNITIVRMLQDIRDRLAQPTGGTTIRPPATKETRVQPSGDTDAAVVASFLDVTREWVKGSQGTRDTPTLRGRM
jgi:hypothetical protein